MHPQLQQEKTKVRLCSLMMSPFSLDFIKTELKYQHCFNLQVYSIYIAPLDGRTSILAYYRVI